MNINKKYRILCIPIYIFFFELEATQVSRNALRFMLYQIILDEKNVYLRGEGTSPLTNSIQANEISEKTEGHVT